MTLSWLPAVPGHAAVTEAWLAEIPVGYLRGNRALACGEHAGFPDMVEDSAAVIESKNESSRQARSLRHVTSDHNQPIAPSHLNHLALA